MSRHATQPLSSSACAAADDEIYARHANDPRPNALYDINGNRLPLDPNDPSQEALRSEWMDLYEAYGGDVAYDPPSSAPDDSLSDEENDISIMPVSTGGPVEECPYEEAIESDDYQYAVWVKVVTRIGRVPVRGVRVVVDGEVIGPTNHKCETAATGFRTSPTFTIKATYENDGANLKRETQLHNFTEVRAKSCTANAGAGQVQIPGIRPSGKFNPNFSDSYTPDHEWQDTQHEKLHFVHVTICLATLSLDVPYRSQMDKSETITWNGQQMTFSDDKICSPTCMMMLLDYWGANGVTRPQVMLNCAERWDHFWGSNAFEAVIPWQSWPYLNDQQRDPLFFLLPSGVNRRGNGTTAQESYGTPSAQASLLADGVANGMPAMIGTQAAGSGGHVLVMRGAIASADQQIRWMIFNDPYGNLDLPSSKLNKAGTNEDKGRHVYYNDESPQYFSSDKFVFGPRYVQFARIGGLSIEEISARLVPGQ